MARFPRVVNGWEIRAAAPLIHQIRMLIEVVEQLKVTHPEDYQKKNATKRLLAILKLMYEVVPEDPERREYRQGDTLGDAYQHWFRAKFQQQYRLFFRYHKQSKIIVFAWVNDDRTKRTYGSKTDAYKVFREMLDSGDPPDSWADLLEVSIADVGMAIEADS